MALVAGDSFLYGDIAKTWMRRGIYGFTVTGPTPGSIKILPTLIRLPGYPIFLAACFRLFGMEHYNAVLYVQVAADLVTCWLAAALSARLFGRRATLPVLWLAILCPFTASYTAAALTETLVLNSIALAFYGFVRWQDAGHGYNRWLWVIGAAMAWSILLRPEQGLLAAAVLPAMLWRSLATSERNRPPGAALPVLAAALCAILPLLPWTARNWHTFHVFEPLVPRYANDPGEIPPTGFGRWYRTWAIEFISTENVYWNYTGDRIELADVSARAFDAGSPAKSEDLRNRTAALIADYDQSTTRTQNVVPAIDARFNALAAERIQAHPVLYYFGLPIARVADMTFRPRTEMMPVALDWWNWTEHPAQSAFAAAYAALNLGYIVIGLAGFYLWKRRGWFAPDSGRRQCHELAIAMAASLVLRVALLLTLDNSEPRYTLEFFPVLFVWAGALFASTSVGTAAEQSE